MEERIPEFFGQKLLISSLLNNIYLSIEHVQTTNALTLCLDVNIHLAKTHFTNAISIFVSIDLNFVIMNQTSLNAVSTK